MRMVDMKNDDHEYLEGDEFVALARAILAKRNTGNIANDWLEIRTNHNGLDLQVRRCRQMDAEDHPTEGHLRVDNPVTMVMNGEVIRHHGEHTYLTRYMRDMLEKS